MRYPLTVPGFTRNPIEVETPGLLSGARVLQSGEPAPKGPKRGTVTLRRDDGSDSVGRLRMTGLGIDPVPAVEIDGTRYDPVKRFAWYELVWLALPLLLISVGGGTGAALGVVASLVNGRVFRSDQPAALRYAMTGGVSILAVITWLIVATVIRTALGR